MHLRILAGAFACLLPSYAWAMSQMDLPAGYPPPSSYIDGAMIGLVASTFILIAGGWLRAPNSVRSLPWAVGCMLLMTTACLAVDSDGTKPDPALTTGAPELATQDVNVICHRGRHKGETTAAYRHTTAAEKNAVYQEYGLATHHSGWCAGPNGCRVDHVTPIECGGADVKANLFPQKGDGPYNQEDKNRLEGLCHKLVCAGKITPAEGQAWFMPDWTVEYDRRFGPIRSGEAGR